VLSSFVEKWNHFHQKPIYVCYQDLLPLNVVGAILWLMNDNGLLWMTVGDDFSFIDFWGSLLG
jgi:hypothetical protein